MSVTNKQPSTGAGGLLPARLADGQLDHVERVVQYMTRTDAVGAFRFDHGYWERRLRTLAETHDLVTSQRHRVLMLLNQLERHAMVSMRKRTTA